MNTQIYIVINNSLNMSKGKAVTQACHGMTKMTVYMNKNNSIFWEKYTKSGEKKIVLKATNEQFEKLSEKYENKTNKNIFCFKIIDAGFTQIPAGSETCLVFCPIQTNEIPNDLKILKLY